MEDTLRVAAIPMIAAGLAVLILVLMEDTLRVEKKSIIESLVSLNPCSNGRYSQRDCDRFYIASSSVLILVLMEDTLRDCDRFYVASSSVS